MGWAGEGGDGSYREGDGRRHPADIYLPRGLEGRGGRGPQALDLALTSGMRADLLAGTLQDPTMLPSKKPTRTGAQSVGTWDRAHTPDL